MSAEPAYRIDALAEGGFASSPARNVRGIRAERTGTREQSTTSLLVTAAKMAAIVLVVVAALSFGRIALTNASVTTLIESDAVSTQIAEARSTGVALEMEQSVLTNTSAIKMAAKRLGMEAPLGVGTLALTPDVVALASDGSLSLADSVNKLVGARG